MTLFSLQEKSIPTEISELRKTDQTENSTAIWKSLTQPCWETLERPEPVWLQYALQTHHHALRPAIHDQFPSSYLYLKDFLLPKTWGNMNKGKSSVVQQSAGFPLCPFKLLWNRRVWTPGEWQLLKASCTENKWSRAGRTNLSSSKLPLSLPGFFHPGLIKTTTPKKPKEQKLKQNRNGFPLILQIMRNLRTFELEMLSSAHPPRTAYKGMFSVYVRPPINI